VNKRDRSPGATVDGLIGALVGMGIPGYEAPCDTSEQIMLAKAVLKQMGAEDISSTGEASAETKAAAQESKL
jgi:hypothetical protein